MLTWIKYKKIVRNSSALGRGENNRMLLIKQDKSDIRLKIDQTCMLFVNIFKTKIGEL